MSVEGTAAVVNSYLFEPGRYRIADDAIYTLMGSGRRAQGRPEVERLLDSLYREAFEAGFEPRTIVIGDGSAAVEADFVGRHVGEFEGIAPTGRDVRVPMCVVYSVDEQHIRSANIYFEMDSLRRQLEPA